VEIAAPSGVTRVWVPLSLSEDTDYQRTLERTWTGNAVSAQAVRDPRYGAGFVVAEWPAGATGPVLEVVNRIATRDRRVDLSGPGAGAGDGAGRQTARGGAGGDRCGRHGRMTAQSSDQTALTTRPDLMHAVQAWM